MPAWLHARAEHILAKNPSMPKSEAFAIATQQSHALGKTPKSYGTATGKHVAKEKYDTPGDDKRTANPGKLKSSVMLKEAVSQEWVTKAVGKAKASPKRLTEFAREAVRTGEGMLPPTLHGPRRYDDAMTMAQHQLPGSQHASKRFAGARAASERLEAPISRVLDPSFVPPKPAKPGFLSRLFGKQASSEWEDKIPGGLSDKKTPADFDSSSLREGEKVEKEHTSDKHLQKEISMDHLTEDPEYYRKLKKMESDEKRATLLAFHDELQKIAEAGPAFPTTRPMTAMARAVIAAPPGKSSNAFHAVQRAQTARAASGPIAPTKFQGVSNTPIADSVKDISKSAFARMVLKLAQEKDSDAFRSSAATSSLPATNRAVQAIPQRLSRQNSFQAAPIGMPSRGNVSPPTTVKPQPPRGALNPGGGML